MRFLRIAAASFIAAYFLWFAAEGLKSYFGPDDMMNLYKAWSCPAGDVWKANVLFWSDEPARPMGAAFYRVVFAVFGFNPLPFRIAALALTALNVWLAYAVARRIARSSEAGALAAIVFAYHPYLFDIYLNTGMIYDVLCFTFAAATLLWYVRIREAGRLPGILETLGLAVSYIGALNSKEMAVTLPLLMAVYELTHHGLRGTHWRSLAKRFTIPALLALMTVPYVIGKQAMTANPAYKPAFTTEVFFRMWADYAQQIFHDAEVFNARKLILLWVVLIAIAWRTRNRALWFAFAWLFAAMLPIVFIPAHRSGFVLYVPWLGWAIYAGALIAQARAFLSERFHFSLRHTAAAQIALFAVLAVLLLSVNRRAAPDAQWGTKERASVKAIVDQIRGHELRPNSRVLVTDDWLEPDDYMLYFTVKLWHADDTIVVDRVKQMRRSPGPNGYDWVIRFDGLKLVELRRRSS